MKRKQNKVRVGAFEFDVKSEADLRGDDGEKLDGQFVPSRALIKLNSGLCNQLQHQTLWHEIVHSLAYQSHLKLGESTVDILANGIVQVLRDNDWIRGSKHMK